MSFFRNACQGSDAPLLEYNTVSGKGRIVAHEDTGGILTDIDDRVWDIKHQVTAIFENKIAA